MAISKITVDVFITGDGMRHLTLEDAQKHQRETIQKEVRDWLGRKLYEEGGDCRDFDLGEAISWIINNIDEIKDRLDGKDSKCL